MTSKIKVDNINKVSDDSNIIKKCGSTTTVGSGAGNTVVVCGSTVTIGRCGGTVALASGSTQTGFGREGSVNWQTGSIKTSTFTAVSGEGYFVDTSSGAVTVNLPAGSAGAIVAFADYTRTFGTNKLTISPNGSNKIGGIAADAQLNVDGQSATFVFVDATEGWINVQETQNSQAGRSNIIATGGTVTTTGDFKVHTFTGPGTFCVSQVSSVSAENTVAYMVVAGGASGGCGGCHGGGGGAGGYREGRNATIDNYTASPLVANAPTNAVTITATAFPITVGAGGAEQGNYRNAGNSGSPSTFSTITSAGGGGGGGWNTTPGNSGGSGGGAATPGGSGAAGNTPPVTPPQGNPGGTPCSSAAMGGGGGAAEAGGADSPPATGGDGVPSIITGVNVTRAGGGGGGRNPSQPPVPGGDGGGGAGSNDGSTGTAGTANTGGGGGGQGQGGPSNGGAGGSGIVVIRYKFQ